MILLRSLSSLIIMIMIISIDFDEQLTHRDRVGAGRRTRVFQVMDVDLVADSADLGRARASAVILHREYFTSVQEVFHWAVFLQDAANLSVWDRLFRCFHGYF